MKKLFLLFVFFLEIQLIFAQNQQIKGIVLNPEGHGIPGVIIKLRVCDSISKTDSEGKFLLEIPKNITNYKFESIENMATLSIEPISDREFKIILSHNLLDFSITELLNLTVSTANKSAEKISTIPASVAIISREDIQNYGYNSLSEILQNISGIYLIDDYHWLGSKNFGVRGFFSTGQSNDMVILVNGVSQLSDKYGDYPDVKINVPVEAIERIEVIKGPMSVIYGTGAFFGVINIITKNTSEKTENTISASFGNYNSQKYNIRIEGKEENVNFTLNTSYTTTEGIDVPFSNLTTKLGNLDYVGINQDATTAGQMDDIRKYLNLNLEYKDFFLDLAFAETIKDVFDAQPNYYDGSEMTTHASNIVIGYEKEINEKITTRVKLGYYSHNHMLNYSVFRPYYYEIDAQNTSSIDLELNLFLNLNDKININTGLYRRNVLAIHQVSDFGYYGISYGAGEIGLPKGESYATHAIYSQLQYSPTDKLKLVTGLRLEHLQNYNMYYSRGTVSEDSNDGLDPNDVANRRIINSTYIPDKNGLTLIPRMAILYSINNKNIIKILVGTATKQPSFSENYRQLPGNRPQLDVASITTYEINYLANFLSKIDVSFSLFHNQLNNLIVATNTYNQETGEWDIYSSNSGKMETKGAELASKLAISKKLSFNLGGTFQKSENLKEGYENIELAYSPQFLANASMLYKFTKNISFSLSGIYTSKMETAWKTATTPNEGARIGNTMEAYTILNSNFYFTNLFKKNIFLNLKLKNILDVEVRYPTTTSNIWIDKGSLGYGREIMGSIGFNF